MTLSGSNSYAGGTTVAAGVLAATQTAALPNFGTAGQLTVQGGATLDLSAGGPGQFQAAGLNNLLTGNAAGFAAGSQLAIDTTGGSLAIPTAIAGNMGLTKLGGNNLTLAASNNYAGPTIVSAGTLTQGVPGSIPQGSPTVNGTLDLNGLNYTANSISGSGAVTSSGTAGIATLTIGAGAPAAPSRAPSSTAAAPSP